ncbi:MAG TPA: hemolysin family protein [Candidatus Ruminococcus gallistercoris]|nr:hemolysin family protein [Candidatus Ruminococcus gallistercoris]
MNAFFAATEIAVISLNEKRVKARAEDGDKKAVKMLRMIEEPTRFLSTIQIGITLANLLGSAFAADNFAERLSGFFIQTFQISEAYTGVINTVAIVVITIILSFFTLVLGELVPKRVAMRHKEKLAEAVCGVISFLAVVLKPIIWLLTVSTNGVLRLFGIDPQAKEEPASTEDIILMLDAGVDEGSLDQNDIEYIKNVFKLDGMIAEDVMMPRKSVVFVAQDETDEEIMKKIEEEGYSRMPVYAEKEDHIIGILHTRDYLLKRGTPGFTLDQVMLPPVFVPETAHLDALFKDMQTGHNHMVIVVNEYGETAGIVTMEDILEELVGEIWDERDEAVEDFKKAGDGTYTVLCSAFIEDFFEFFSLENQGETEASTVNGWLTELSGSIPKVGYTFDYENLTITVTKADGLMAHEISVKVNDQAKEPEEEKPEE